MQLFQLELDWLHRPRAESGVSEVLEINGRPVSILYRRNALARRYRLFVDREGQPRVTIPKRGSRREAERFVREHRDWLARQLLRAQSRRAANAGWRPGSEILFRGQSTTLGLVEREDSCVVTFSEESFIASAECARADFDLRPLVENHLRSLAERELPPRVAEMAARHGSPVRRVTVRSQRSRWGSCSRRGTISLNWRLVQTPCDVRDYIIVHELMHFREMNHSPRFWAHVAAAFPDFKEAELWLRRNGRHLL